MYREQNVLSCIKNIPTTQLLIVSKYKLFKYYVIIIFADVLGLCARFM